MSTHAAVVTVAPRAPLEIHALPTVKPAAGEVRVKVEWTASTPLDLHQADGGLLVKHPQVLGDGVAGTVVEVGPNIKSLKVGDKVFGFCWRTQKEKAFQTYATVPEIFLGLLPEGFTMQEAVVLGNNFVTAYHTIPSDLGLPLPWPRPEGYVPEHAESPILIWGGSSSVGQYALQILKYFGYRKLLTTASKKHHELLKSYGATETFDYHDPDINKSILEPVRATSKEPRIPFILDCIASQSGSLEPISRIAESGAKVAVLLPVIIRDASDTEVPEYSMDAQASARWADRVKVIGVRTHFYTDNKFHAEHLQSTIMPAMLAQGIVKPNKQRIIEGPTLLARAQAALDTLRRKEASGERLVWRIAEEDE